MLSSLALAGILTANVLGANVNATTEGEYLKPVGVYKRLVEGKTVVPYVLKDKNTPVTVKDVQSEFTNLESVNGTKVTDMNATMGTGDTFRLEGEEEDYTVIVYGDVTGEGKISTKDALLIQKIALKKETNVSKEVLEAADVNNNGKISTKDALAVQKYVLGKGEYQTVIDELPPVEDTTAPVFNGIIDKIIVKLNDENFQLPEVTATDDYDGEVEVIKTGEVNLAEEGEYNIKYTAIDKAGNQATAIITVIVDGTNPILSGVTDKDIIRINLNDPNFQLPEVTATDNYDEEIEVIKKGEVNLLEEGEYEIVYTATDKAGNTTTATLTVIVDNQAPVINGIVDGQKIYVKLGNEEFTLPEVTANDAVDGKVEVTIQGKENIDVTTQGEYEVTYLAKDTLDNVTTITVTVVVDGTAPKADVNYSTTVLTKENVIVTIISDELIQAPEGWELSEDGKSMKKAYSENVVDEKLIVSDMAGNETETHIKISNIDNKVVATPSYSTTSPTKADVIATITSNEILQPIEGWDLATDKMSMTKTYTDNKIEDIIVKDSLGNETIVTIDIRNIDKIAPTAGVEFDITELTNGDVKATIIANESLQSVVGDINIWQLDAEDDKKATTTFTVNGDENVTITDLAGNESIIPVKVSNIDKVAPTLTVDYNIKVSTNQNVIATIISNEPIQEKEGWTLATDSLSMTKEYKENISEEVVEVKDLAGNLSTVTVTITNIDKEAPIVTGLTEGKNSYQSVTLGFTEGIATIQKEGEPAQEYTTNTPVTTDGNYVLVVTDAAGNTTTKRFTIDNVVPVFETMEAKLLKKGDVFNTSVVATDAVDGEIEASLVITFNGNPVDNIDTTGANDGEYTLTYTATDEAGNTATATRVVTVDATPARPTIIYSTPSTESAIDIIVRVSFNEKMQLPEASGWTVEDDNTRLAFTKKYTVNMSETVEFKDIAGNPTFVEIDIKNIDSEEPSATKVYSTKEPTKEPVEVKIIVNKEIQPVVGWNLSADKKSITKVYSENTVTPEIVTIKDLVGHETTVEVQVTNIDKTAPIGTVTYSETEATKNDITVTIEAGEQLQPLAGWTLAENGLSMKKIYTKNTIGAQTITIKDLAGNESDVTVTIANIDREAPVVTGFKEGINSYQEVTPVFTDANPIQATLQKGTEAPVDFTSGTTISEEGSYKLYVTDSLGNALTILFNIDKTNPTINGVVEGGRYTSATPTFTKGVGKLNKLDPNNGDAIISTDIYVSGTPITKDGKYQLIVTDAAGNTAMVTFVVDTTSPDITGVQNNGIYNQTVTPNATTNGTIEEVNLTKDGVKVDGYTLGTPISEEGIYILTVTDDLGKANMVKFTIDTTGPVVTGVEDQGEYKTVTPIFTEGTATLQKGAGTATTFTSGTEISADDEYVLVVTDKAANQTIINFTIDNVAPVIEDVVNNTTYNQAVTPVNVAGDVETVVLTKDGRVDTTYTTLGQITGDGVYQLTVADKAGNETTIKFTIDTQVKDVTYTTSNNNKPTKNSVMVTIRAKEKLQPVTGWNLSSDALSMTKVYDNDSTQSVDIKDLAGNMYTVNVVVTGIDRTAPEIVGTPTYSDTTPATKGPVTVTIVANEPIQEVSGWNLADDKKTLTKTFTDNTTEKVTLIDLAGNEIATPIQVTIDNIYATGPVIIGMYEQEEITIDKTSTGNIDLPIVTATDIKGGNVAVTTTIQKLINEVDLENVTEIDVTSRGSYKITYTATDVAGNTSKVERIIHVV